MHLTRFRSPYPKHLSPTKPLGALHSNNCSCLHCLHNITCSESNGVTLRSWHADNAWFIFLYMFLKTSRLNFPPLHHIIFSRSWKSDKRPLAASDVFIFAPSVGYFHFVILFYGQLAFDIHLLQRIGLQRVIFVIDLSICLFVSCLFWSTKKPDHLEKSQSQRLTTVQVLNCLLLLHQKWLKDWENQKLFTCELQEPVDFRISCLQVTINKWFIILLKLRGQKQTTNKQANKLRNLHVQNLANSQIKCLVV